MHTFQNNKSTKVKKKKLQKRPKGARERERERGGEGGRGGEREIKNKIQLMPRKTPKKVSKAK